MSNQPDTYCRLFADEAGCFRFDRHERASRYFVLCTVRMDDPAQADILTQLRRDLVIEGFELKEFHASYDQRTIHYRVFETLQKMDFRIDATIMEKSKAEPHIRIDEPTFCKFAWYFHLLDIAPMMEQDTNKFIITIAQYGDRKMKGRMRDAINDVTQQILRATPCHTILTPASTDPCLQIADYCAWAIQRRWEKEDTRFYDYISDKINREFDLWSHGQRHFY